ncbi:hypothetical protein [Kitasatospora purpeofusca]
MVADLVLLGVPWRLCGRRADPAFGPGPIAAVSGWSLGEPDEH